MKKKKLKKRAEVERPDESDEDEVLDELDDEVEEDDDEEDDDEEEDTKEDEEEKEVEEEKPVVKTVKTREEDVMLLMYREDGKIKVQPGKESNIYELYGFLKRYVVGLEYEIDKQFIKEQE